MTRGYIVRVPKGATYTTNRNGETSTTPHKLRKSRLFAVEYVFASDGQVAERLPGGYENYYKPEDVEVVVAEKHHPTYCGRREVGKSPIRGFGSIYMSKVKCECGWQNERCANQKECEEAHASHIDAIVEKEVNEAIEATPDPEPPTKEEIDKLAQFLCEDEYDNGTFYSKNSSIQLTYRERARKAIIMVRGFDS